MQNRPIIITREDHAKLLFLTREADGFLRHDHDALASLTAKLKDAEFVEPSEVPADVITLYSRAELVDLADNEPLDLTIVLPHEADPSINKISVLSPIGLGMLGYKVGDVFEQSTPRGDCRFQVRGVLYQPESAQAKADQATLAQSAA